jgi:hypothetical protein
MTHHPAGSANSHRFWTDPLGTTAAPSYELKLRR